MCSLAQVVVVLGVVVSSCGGDGGLPAGVAVRVGNYTVSKVAVAHWTPIEAIVSQELIPRGPVPKGMVPDPPDYSNCILYQRKLAERAPGAKHMPSLAQLKHECRKRYEAERAHILNFLIAYGWLREEAALHGLKVSDVEVRRRYKEHTRAEFSDAAFHQYLARTGLTEADELLRVKNSLLATLVLEKVFNNQSNPKQAYPEFLLRWVAQTHCAPNYITPNCREYKGPLSPEG
jgi:foldase protein PrsA